MIRTRIITFRLPAHGSTAKLGHVPISVAIERAHNFASKYLEGTIWSFQVKPTCIVGKRVIVIGFSVGGLIALHLMKHFHPDSVYIMIGVSLRWHKTRQEFIGKKLSFFQRC